MQRMNYSSGTPWESLAGYSRAVRLGKFVFVAGTAASDSEGKVQHKENAYEQTKYILRKIERSLTEAGSKIGDVVRTRIFVTDISLYQDILKAHNEFFHNVRPVCTMVEVSSLISDEMLVEVEVDAIIQ